jgi:hypothetical protein
LRASPVGQGEHIAAEHEEQDHRLVAGEDRPEVPAWRGYGKGLPEVIADDRERRETAHGIEGKDSLARRSLLQVPFDSFTHPVILFMAPPAAA